MVLFDTRLELIRRLLIEGKQAQSHRTQQQNQGNHGHGVTEDGALAVLQAAGAEIALEGYLIGSVVGQKGCDAANKDGPDRGVPEEVSLELKKGGPTPSTSLFPDSERELPSKGV